jgi:hypothetical protein
MTLKVIVHSIMGSVLVWIQFKRMFPWTRGLAEGTALFPRFRRCGVPQVVTAGSSRLSPAPFTGSKFHRHRASKSGLHCTHSTLACAHVHLKRSVVSRAREDLLFRISERHESLWVLSLCVQSHKHQFKDDVLQKVMWKVTFLYAGLLWPVAGSHVVTQGALLGTPQCHVKPEPLLCLQGHEHVFKVDNLHKVTWSMTFYIHV